MQGKWPIGFLVCLALGQMAPVRTLAADMAEEPDLEFLEYLGGLVEEQGRWVGPEEMEEWMSEEKMTRDEEMTSSEETP